tara:strand:+ start:793 stop:1425 length:633 start_codon:yes stop_codon:yes gene_type:complete
MKIDNTTLRRIIKEELSRVLLEEEISNIQNLDEGLGTTFAMLMGMWTGMAGDDNSLELTDLDGNKMEISETEFEEFAKIVDKLADSDNAPAVKKSIEIMKDIDGNGVGPRAGLLDLNNVYGDGAPQVMDAVFHAVDGKFDNAELSVGADQPEGSTSSHSVSVEGTMRMIDADLQTNKIERAKERAQKLLDNETAGITPEERAKLQSIINS